MWSPYFFGASLAATELRLWSWRSTSVGICASKAALCGTGHARTVDFAVLRGFLRFRVRPHNARARVHVRILAWAAASVVALITALRLRRSLIGAPLLQESQRAEVE